MGIIYPRKGNAIWSSWPSALSEKRNDQHSLWLHLKNQVLGIKQYMHIKVRIPS